MRLVQNTCWRDTSGWLVHIESFGANHGTLVADLFGLDAGELACPPMTQSSSPS